MNKSKVGTRGSRLAIAQTKIALRSLRRVTLREFEIVPIITRGDVDKRRPLFSMNEKGIFEKELDRAVISGKVDFAVHSLKDIPSNLSKKLVVASIPKRSKPNDVLVSKRKLRLLSLPCCAIVGTSSLRRAIQLLKLRSDLRVKPIRGNVERRVVKSMEGDYDAVVLAEAGLTRLGMADAITQRFSVGEFVPAPGQGAIAMVCRRDNAEVISMLKQVEDARSRIEADAELSLTSKLEAGCRFPVGAIAARIPGKDTFTLYASIFSPDGTKNIKAKKIFKMKNAGVVGNEMAEMLLRNGATELAAGWRAAVKRWNRQI
jgi:hydroxymethylbilane synthase